MTSTYPSYKPTTIPWLPLMPQHWELIGFNFLFRDNKEKNKGMKESLILSLSYGNIIRKRKEENFGLIPESFETYQVLNPGYIVLRLTDLQNDKRSLRVGYVNERGIITSAYTGLVPNKVNSRYYYYFLHYLDIRKHFYSLGGGVRQSSDYNELKKQKFPFPPLSEQSAIVNYLDTKTKEIVDFIEKKQKLISLLREQKLGIVNEQLRDKESNWVLRKLKFCVTKVGSGVTPRGGAAVYTNSGIPLLRSQNIHNDRIALEDVAYISQEIHDSMSGSKVCSGDVLLNITGGSLGRCYFVSENLGEANVNQHVSILRPHKKKIISEFLQLLLISELGNSQIWKEQTGSGREGLTSDSIKNFVFPVPKITEQYQIVDRIKNESSQIDIAINRIEKEIELVKVLKQSLVAEVVTGKIKVI